MCHSRLKAKKGKKNLDSLTLKFLFHAEDFHSTQATKASWKCGI